MNLPSLRRSAVHLRQHRQRCKAMFPLGPLLLTVLTETPRLLQSLMIRLPAWPSRLKTISMPSARQERLGTPQSARECPGGFRPLAWLQFHSL
jgi:hypothetical protein